MSCPHSQLLPVTYMLYVGPSHSCIISDGVTSEKEKKWSHEMKQLQLRNVNQ